MASSDPLVEEVGPHAEELAARIISRSGEIADGLRTATEEAPIPRLSQVAAARALLADVNSAMRILVTDARRAGASWQAVGDLLGTTRQAAQQRFGDRGEAAFGAEARRRAARWSLMVLNWWKAGQVKEVRETFDSELGAQLTEDQLAAAWALVEAAEGPLVGQGEPVVVRRGSLLVVEIPLKFERAVMKARVALGTGGAVAGLFLLHPEIH